MSYTEEDDGWVQGHVKTPNTSLLHTQTPNTRYPNTQTPNTRCTHTQNLCQKLSEYYRDWPRDGPTGTAEVAGILYKEGYFACDISRLLTEEEAVRALPVPEVVKARLRWIGKRKQEDALGSCKETSNKR